MSKNTISVSTLFLKYDGFIFCEMGSELAGYSKEKSEYVIIDDGMCISTQDCWLVHHYKITNPNFQPFEYKGCQEDDGKKISGKWIKLNLL